MTDIKSDFGNPCDEYFQLRLNELFSYLWSVFREYITSPIVHFEKVRAMLTTFHDRLKTLVIVLKNLVIIIMLLTVLEC